MIDWLAGMRRPGFGPGRRALAAAALLVLGPLAARAEDPVTLFAAASTSDAVAAVAAAFEATGGGHARTVVAASSTLARQIAHGAPADLFLSASAAWMDDLAARGAIDPASRVDLLGNRLVLIAPAGADFRVEIGPGLDLAGVLGDRRLAIGDPAHVPAGIYAKAALERLGAWAAVAPKAAFAGSVRAALALVDRGEAGAGIVYATDAAISPRVRVVGTFPADSHGPIVYPLALVRGPGRPEARAFYDYLRGPEARRIFRAHGFTVLGPGG